MRPQIEIKLRGVGGYRANRYLYGGTAGIPWVQYSKYVLYNDPTILYNGGSVQSSYILYGDHVCYGGPGGTFFETDNQPSTTQVINKPILNIL